MLIPGDASLPVFEVEFDCFNVLTKNHDRKFDYVHAKDADEAKKRIRWVHGSCVDILRVEES